MDTTGHMAAHAHRPQGPDMTTSTDNRKEPEMTDTERSKHYRFRI